MITRYSIKTFVSFAVTAVATTLILGCSSTMGNDGAGNQMNSGLVQTRSGLVEARSGVASITAGAREAGTGHISNGMGSMRLGLDKMGQGMGMMSGSMMMNCADGGSDTILEPMQQAMVAMQRGQAMLASDAGVNDDEALAQMQTGMNLMTSAIDTAQASMNCMGHNGMMTGAMM